MHIHKSVVGVALVINLAVGSFGTGSSGISAVAVDPLPTKDEPKVEMTLDELIEFKSNQYQVSLPLVREIIRRESGFRPWVCNQTYGCTSGQRLMQLIPSTVKYCNDKLGRTIDPFIASDNLDCGLWLLKNEGIRHWQGYSGDYSGFMQ